MNTIKAGKTRAAICTDLVPTAEFARNPEWDADAPSLIAKITAQVDADNFFNAPALAWASKLMGDSIAANMFMLGVAWQRGWVPVSLSGLMQAIELNGVQIEQTKEAFEWGRRAAVDKDRVDQQAEKELGTDPSLMTASPVAWHERSTQTLDELVAHRSAMLVDYGGKSKGYLLAKRYQSLLARVSALQANQDTGFKPKAFDKLQRAIATQYFRLLAVKDEWEVARLYAAPEFAAQLKETFVGVNGRDYKLHFHLGAWPFAQKDPVTGHTVKAELGAWVLPVFKVMAKLRGLRGSMIDPFKRSEERMLADRLLAQYESDIAQVMLRLNAENLDAAIQLANLPEKIRGYGYVRVASADSTQSERALLLATISG
jgi:indolepyruvate ferredoxin oxidoreductase